MSSSKKNKQPWPRPFWASRLEGAAGDHDKGEIEKVTCNVCCPPTTGMKAAATTTVSMSSSVGDNFYQKEFLLFMSLCALHLPSSASVVLKYAVTRGCILGMAHTEWFFFHRFFPYHYLQVVQTRWVNLLGDLANGSFISCPICLLSRRERS